MRVPKKASAYAKRSNLIWLLIFQYLPMLPKRTFMYHRTISIPTWYVTLFAPCVSYGNGCCRGFSPQFPYPRILLCYVRPDNEHPIRRMFRWAVFIPLCCHYNIKTRLFQVISKKIKKFSNEMRVSCVYISEDTKKHSFVPWIYT